MGRRTASRKCPTTRHFRTGARAGCRPTSPHLLLSADLLTWFETWRPPIHFLLDARPELTDFSIHQMFWNADFPQLTNQGHIDLLSIVLSVVGRCAVQQPSGNASDFADPFPEWKWHHLARVFIARKMPCTTGILTNHCTPHPRYKRKWSRGNRPNAMKGNRRSSQSGWKGNHSRPTKGTGKLFYATAR